MVIDHYNLFNSFRKETVLRSQNLTSLDIRFKKSPRAERVELNYCLHQSKMIYRIIPNKGAGSGDKVRGAFIMCIKM